MGEAQPTDYHYMQFFSIVLRSAMEKIQLELIRRNYYNPKASITLGQYKLELRPGYVPPSGSMSPTGPSETPSSPSS